MRRLFAMLIVLASASSIDAQIMISGSITQEQVIEAQKQKSSADQLLRMAAGVKAKLEVGEFDVIVREDKIKSDLLWQWTDWDKRLVTANNCAYVIRHDVAAGETLVIRMKRAGDDKVKTHRFPAKTEPWTWVEAVADGEATLAVSANGDPGKMPVVVSNVAFTIGNPAPTPTPGPKPDVIVTPVTGFRVVFVYEKDTAMTKDQTYALNSPRINDYLNQKCAKDDKGRPSWRKWDKDVTLAATEVKVFQDLWPAIKPKLGTLPQVAIVRDSKVDLFAMPADEQKTLELLQTYGGK